LKYIFRVGVGTDNIDVEYCKKHWIQIVINPGANSHSVADLALWGTLTLLRRTKLLMQDLSVWKFSSRFTYQWNELVSKVVTIVWFGHVGKLVYNRLKAFGVQDFMIVDPFLDRETIEAFDWCAKCESLEEVIWDTDLLYLHLPLNEHTRDTINYALLSQTKSNIQIINLSRWWIIKESDLYNFLKTNTQAWAYLDVWEWDPEFTEIIKQLMQLDNCLISPHLGSVTEEATKKMHSFQL
jgi:D-3-phosphoglycerate dehydrogenase